MGFSGIFKTIFYKTQRDSTGFFRLVFLDSIDLCDNDRQ